MKYNQEFYIVWLSLIFDSDQTMNEWMLNLLLSELSINEYSQNKSFY